MEGTAGATGAGPGGAALRNMENHEAYSILDELQKDGRLEADNADEAKEKFYKLHEALVINMENEHVLMKKARQLQKELGNELLKLEKTQQQQAENEAMLKELNNQVVQVRKEMDDCTEKRFNLGNEEKKLDVDKQELQAMINMKVQNERDRLIPEIERFEKMIRDIKVSNEEYDQTYDSETQKNNEQAEKLKQLESTKEELKEEFEGLQGNYIKEKDEPTRLGKGNENLRIAVQHLKNDMEGLQKECENVEKHHEIENNVKRQYEDQMKMLKEDFDEKNQGCKDVSNVIERSAKEIHALNNANNDINEQRVQVDIDIQASIQTKKRFQVNYNRMNKEYDDAMKLIKKLENENIKIVNNYKELKTEKEVVEKLREEKEKQIKILKKDKDKLTEEQHISVGLMVKKGLEDVEMQAKGKKIDADIDSHNMYVEQFQVEEDKWIEEIKFLSTIREKMARTASQAMAQARETKEELKVKELLILDLTKKQQETEFRLNSFIALYEEVKNARNKYVSQIQSSSQDLAEMKERIKILQNEVEILRNESSEKDRVLADCKKSVQQEVQNRDSLRADLNKRELTYKNKMSIIGQKINEGDKLNLIINQLQKEMNNLIFKYEMACESRNYMGIQLIDKNDELCILYEKSNIQENILKSGEQEIRQKEEEIRMINLELKERQRQLEVIKKQIPLVPDLAEQVLGLKKSLDGEKEKVDILSSKLENPEKHPRKMELAGEDADPEALQAKIQVLEERLNNKKESLLEKELVYEEVSNLAEKLRTQALDGRKSTLEIAEKINEYKARTTELSRKMLATVSELSMFQSKALKLQTEKEEKEQLLEQAVQRMENGMAPTDQADAEWEKKVRDQQRRQQDKVERIRRKQLEQSLPPNGVKTTALPRPNSYMPPDIQIPKPYGSFQPFKPSEPGANMRHIKNPKPIEIEY